MGSDMSDDAASTLVRPPERPALLLAFESASTSLFMNPIDAACQDQFIDAARALRKQQVAAGVQEPLGSSYPRTSNKSFSHSEIAAALFYGVLRFGKEKIDWARLTTDAYRPVSGELPQWASSSTDTAEVYAGRAPTVDPWRKARISEVDKGYVARFDTNLAIPIQSYSSRDSMVPHGSIPGVEVRIDSEGFPVFDVGIDVMMPYDRFGCSDNVQFRFCNREVANRVSADPVFRAALPPDLQQLYSAAFKTNAPSGWVWHHHQDAGRMQLVRSRDHDAVVVWRVSHTGGAAIWCSDFRHRPKDAKSGRTRRHIFKTFLTMRKRDREKAV